MSVDVSAGGAPPLPVPLYPTSPGPEPRHISSISNACYPRGIRATAAKKPTPLPKSEQRQVQDVESLLQGGVPALISPAGERI
jgi:hypothetical protein